MLITNSACYRGSACIALLSGVLMHHFSHKCEDGKTVHFNYNSDFSGDVLVKVESEDAVSATLEVSGDAILEFVAEHVRRKKISRLEDMVPLAVLYEG